MKSLDPDLRALQEVRDQVKRAKAAVETLQDWDQERVDGLCRAMASAGLAAAHDLARLAVDETGIGRVHYKVLKNILGSEGVWDSIKDERTVGIVSRDERTGIDEVATPFGIVAAIIPTTNPTSTALYKALIGVKGRNAVVISPHPRARRCIGETTEVLRRAIERAGGPPDLVQCLSNPTIESTGALMQHRDVAIILATGGTGLVTAAYSSGKPAYGVGPGNVPCYIDRSADIEAAAAHVTASQSFDNGTLCCSEQALVLDAPIAESLLAAMVARGAHLCSPEETAKLEAVCNVRGGMNADVVGVDPWRVAELSGFRVPRHTTVLLAHQAGVGKEFPLSIEILCPLLSVHVVDGWREGCATSLELLRFDGLGHTLGIHCRDDAVLDAFFREKPANRILVNGRCSEGAVGYSTHLVPAMSLGCGPQAGNITSDNISAKHLVNIKRVARLRDDWFELEKRMHARAARLTGDVAPRGSGLPGDPALAAGGARPASGPASAGGASNWQGNPAFSAPASRPAPSPRTALLRPQPAPPAAAPVAAPASSAAAPPAAPAPKAGGAPRFTDRAPVARASARATLQAATLQAAAPPAGSAVGSSLSPKEIESILAHAGQGCPLGPCQGCPHHDESTGACRA